jgi:hypothetical protein
MNDNDTEAIETANNFSDALAEQYRILAGGRVSVGELRPEILTEYAMEQRSDIIYYINYKYNEVKKSQRIFLDFGDDK